MSVTVHHGDSRKVLKSIADASLDSCVTDPPYALVSISKRFGAEGATPAKAGKSGAYARASAGFMGKKWDTGDTAFDPAFWAEVLRVLKPGAHVVAFGGTRTYHRLACAIEDAGFEVRDQIGWAYGSGFPKSHNVARNIDKAAGIEPTVVGYDASKARPNKRGFAKVAGESLEEEGNAGHKDNGATLTRATSPEAQAWEGWGTALKPAWEPIVLARKPLLGTIAANVLVHGTGALNVDACRVAYDMSDTNPATNPLHRKVAGYANGNASDSGSSSYALKDGSGERSPNDLGRWPANIVHDGSGEVVETFPRAPGQQRAVGPEHGEKVSVRVFGDYGARDHFQPRGDAGSAARFFYSAKADAEDRCGSKHPTVKPTDLMAWLCRLVTPIGGTVLDPFAGSGSTGMACLREGFSAVLIEREAEYVADIQRRIAHVQGTDAPLFAGEAAA